MVIVIVIVIIVIAIVIIIIVIVIVSVIIVIVIVIVIVMYFGGVPSLSPSPSELSRDEAVTRPTRGRGRHKRPCGAL